MKIKELCKIFNEIEEHQLVSHFEETTDRREKLLMIKLLELKLGLAQEEEVGRCLF